ncbi:sugar-phosphatase [Candidatus Steffania adelgidicola]|uniref:sugar-phosphatase n=1 Tax=Candidatus Steffania adelgidicola TaxID=1076626 RepID=UPI001D02F6B2|nr:sugar-phosphatase [Candidatus Steffania adelgidicola]UDG79688.1 Sugar phosphatase YidA [Candidatus Steffania adelgidicola]
MAIKLIAIDIDGTLLNHKHEITSTVKEAIGLAHDQATYIVLATGRPYVGVTKYLIQLDLQKNGNYCITNNGALIQRTVDGSCISQKLLDINDYLYLEALSRQLDVHFHALDFDTLYTANRDISQYTVYEAALTGIPFKFRAVEEMDISLRFPKVMMIDDPDILNSAIKRIPKETFERYTIMKSAPYYLELLNKQANKGKAVKVLAEYLGLNRDEVMTIGDQANDLAMIQYAGTGVAMENAIDEIKAVSQFITTSNVEDGVAFAIQKFILDTPSPTKRG